MTHTSHFFININNLIPPKTILLFAIYQYSISTVFCLKNNNKLNRQVYFVLCLICRSLWATGLPASPKKLAYRSIIAGFS